MKSLIVLFSGNGSNLEALAKNLHNKYFKDAHNNSIKVQISLCVSDNAKAYGLMRCKALGLNHQVLEYHHFTSRIFYEQALLKILESYACDLIILAGFMRILSGYFLKEKVCLNIHPSLLPLYKGLHALERSFKGAECYAGVSVHYVNEELDSGEIILQKSFQKSAFKTLEDFKKQVHAIEHRLYSQAVLKVLGLHA
ncbi:phosphoribosylglycinamide formyltransferase [Helicobacter cetorum]|uniref:phosphoribosylglycinamide formyltransferase n=1 Tax=Helicobacter cetorum TaxID=138563 RepID=UPI000CF1A8E8|nr:phosphoribosylglycinamide formyltransferase [Helicobacter cetorum]